MAQTNRLTQSVVAVTVAVLVVALVFLPILNSALDTTIDGDEATLTNTATASALYSPADELNISTITITATSSAISVDPATATSVISDVFKIDVTSTQLTVQTSSGAAVVFATSDTTLDATLTIDVTGKTATMTGTSATAIPTLGAFTVLYISDASGTYGLYTPTDASPVYANTTKNVIALTSSAIASEKVTATSPIAITSAQYVDAEEQELKNVYSVTDAGTGGQILAPVDCIYYEQVPAIDGNLATIIGILPILVAVGILMAAVYAFVGPSWRSQ